MEYRRLGRSELRVSAIGLVLSSLERDVLSLAAGGMATRDIAVRLQLSGATVTAHLVEAYEKLSLIDRPATIAVGPHAPRP